MQIFILENYFDLRNANFNRLLKFFKNNCSLTQKNLKVFKLLSS